MRPLQTIFDLAISSSCYNPFAMHSNFSEYSMQQALFSLLGYSHITLREANSALDAIEQYYEGFASLEDMLIENYGSEDDLKFHCMRVFLDWDNRPFRDDTNARCPAEILRKMVEAGYIPVNGDIEKALKEYKQDASQGLKDYEYTVTKMAVRKFLTELEEQNLNIFDVLENIVEVKGETPEQTLCLRWRFRHANRCE